MSFLLALSVVCVMTRREMAAEADVDHVREKTWFQARMPCCDRLS